MQVKPAQIDLSIVLELQTENRKASCPYNFTPLLYAESLFLEIKLKCLTIKYHVILLNP